MGRPSLAETISGGVKQFFGTYDTLCQQDSNLPKVDPAVLKQLER
jgi:hypothetical protein